MNKLSCLMFFAVICGCTTNLAVKSISRMEIVEQVVRSVPMISYKDKTGSGILFKNGEQAMILTAAHIIKDDDFLEIVGPPHPDEYKEEKVIHVIGWDRGLDVIEWFCEAEILEVDEKIDFAILRLKSTNPDMNFVSMSNVAASMGEKILMVGNPMMDASSISSGIVSHAHRDPSIGNPSGLRYIQVDASGYFGSSGGGIFREEDGSCIGMVVLRNPNYGAMYALPIEGIRAICPKYF